MFRPTPFQIDNDRFYYEPRALWSVGRVTQNPSGAQPRTETQPQGFLKLDPNDFYNGSRFPIRITHALVSPVGYLFRRITATAPGGFDACMAGLGRMRMRVSFPRRMFVDRLDTDLYSFGNTAVAEQGFEDDGTFDYSSGLLGASRWDFEPSYIAPRKTTIDLQLSVLQKIAGQSAEAKASFLVMERGGRMLGHARVRPPEAVEFGHRASTQGVHWPQTNTPVAGDPFLINVGANGPQTQVFPASGQFPHNVYLHQLAARGLPYTEITGFSVAIDQIGIDDELHAMGLYATAGIAPVAQRIITKARTRDAGTGEWWWKPGAPLSLVTPSLNNCALVHRFAQPFELGPGEGLEVSLQAPPPRTFTFGEQPVTITPLYNVGVSFLGYAVVEDNAHKVYR